MLIDLSPLSHIFLPSWRTNLRLNRMPTESAKLAVRVEGVVRFNGLEDRKNHLPEAMKTLPALHFSLKIIVNG